MQWPPGQSRGSMWDKIGEEKRLHERERFREMVEQAPEPIGILRDGRLLYANAACLSALGFRDTEEAYRTPLASLLDEEESAIGASREASILERGARPPPQT